MLSSAFHWIFVTILLEVMCLSSAFISPVRVEVTTETTRKVCTTLYAPHNNVSEKNSKGDQCIYCTGSDCRPMQEPSHDSIILHICHVSVVRQELNFNPGDTLLPCLRPNTVSGTLQPLLSDLNLMIKHIQFSLENVNLTNSKTTEIKCDVDLLQNLKNTLNRLYLKDPYTYQPILDLINGLKLESLKNTGADSDINGITINVLITLQNLNKLILGLTNSHQLNNTNPSNTPQNISDANYTNNEVFQDMEPQKETNSNVSGNEANLGPFIDEVLQDFKPENEQNSNVSGNEAYLGPFIDEVFQDFKPENESNLNENYNEGDLDSLIDATLPESKPENGSSLNEGGKQVSLDSSDEEFLEFELGKETGPEIQAMTSNIKLILQHLDKIIRDLLALQHMNITGSDEPAFIEFKSVIDSIKLPLQKLTSIKTDLSIFLALRITGSVLPPYFDFTTMMNSFRLTLNLLNKIFLNLSSISGSIQKVVGIVGHPLPDFLSIIGSIQSTLPLLKQISSHFQKGVVGIIGYPLTNHSSLTGSIQATFPHLTHVSIQQHEGDTALSKQIGYGSVIGTIKLSMDSLYSIIAELSAIQILISTGNTEFKGIINSYIQDLLSALNIKVSAESQTLDLLIQKVQLILQRMTTIIDDLHTLQISFEEGTDQSALVDKITQSILHLGFHMHTKSINFNIKVLLPALRKTGSVLTNIIEKFLQLKKRFTKISNEFSPKAVLNKLIGKKKAHVLNKIFG